MSADTPASSVKVDSAKLRELAKLLTDSLTGADNAGSPGYDLFVALPKTVEDPWPDGLNMSRYTDSGDNASSHVGLMPGWCRAGGYFKAGLDVKTAFDHQMSLILTLLKAGTSGSTPTVFGMITDLAQGLNQTADLYDKGEQIVATDLTSLESELGVNQPTPSFP